MKNEAQETTQGTPPRKGARRGVMDIVEDTGSILPVMPTNVVELVSHWKIPQNEIATISVHVLRQKIGTNTQELIQSSVPILDYNLAKIAGNNGPGIYFIRGAHGAWANRGVKIDVSDAYARANGYGEVPKELIERRPSAQDVVAARTLEAAAERTGVDPAAMLGALERIIERLFDTQVRPLQEEVKRLAATRDQRSELERVRETMAMISSIQDMSTKLAAGRPPVEEPREESWKDIIRELVPTVAPVVANIFAPRAQQVAPRAPQVPPSTAIQGETIKGETMPTKSRDERKRELIQMIPEAQRKSIIEGVVMLGKFGDYLAGMDDGKRTPEDTAQGLIGWIPPAAYQSVVDLADVANARPEILGLIHERMEGSDFWRQVVVMMAGEIASGQES